MAFISLKTKLVDHNFTLKIYFKLQITQIKNKYLISFRIKTINNLILIERYQIIKQIV